MSTPYANSVQMSSISTHNLGRYGALTSGYKWGGANWGQSVDLTYSFPTKSSTFAAGSREFHYGDKEDTSLSPLSLQEQSAVRAGLAAWSSLASVNFTQVADNSIVVGDLRFAGTTQGSNGEAAHTYYPSGLPEGGDVWFQQNVWHDKHNEPITTGSYEYLTIIHELGHSLGLKHPFEDGQTLPTRYDSYSYSVMSYSAHDGSFDNYATFYPTTPMFYDIEAIQKLYGRRAHNPDDTTYAFQQGQHYWQTIDDSGGVDTITYAGSNDVTIDLRIRHWSDVGRPIYTNSGKLHDAVAIGPNTVIEDAQGSGGNDILKGNGVANLLSGGAGGDRIKGFDGPDRLLGQDGADRLDGGPGWDVLDGGNGKDLLDGEGGRDTFLFDAALSGETNFDTIESFTHGNDRIALDLHIFKGLSVGALSADAFHAGANADSSSERILYDASSGTLFYDPDGSGAAAPVRFAKLAEPAQVTSADFLVVA